jgi:hypothetical protein
VASFVLEAFEWVLNPVQFGVYGPWYQCGPLSRLLCPNQPPQRLNPRLCRGTAIACSTGGQCQHHSPNPYHNPCHYHYHGVLAEEASKPQLKRPKRVSATSRGTCGPGQLLGAADSRRKAKAKLSVGYSNTRAVSPIISFVARSSHAAPNSAVLKRHMTALNEGQIGWWQDKARGQIQAYRLSGSPCGRSEASSDEIAASASRRWRNEG